jgi:hypothetical protein
VHDVTASCGGGEIGGGGEGTGREEGDAGRRRI